MKLPSTYTLDTETLKLDAYRLLCLFYANKEISRLCDPDGDSSAPSSLERHFFSREMTKLLLGIAIGIRVLDDQMQSLGPDNPERQKYLERKDKVDRNHACMMFDAMSLREACNKIIHATVVEPHSNEGSSFHQIDEHNWLGWSQAHDEGEDAGPEPEPIKWHHLSGHIRLGGQYQKKQWWHLLDVPEFVDAVYAALSEGEQVHAHDVRNARA